MGIMSSSRWKLGWVVYCLLVVTVLVGASCANKIYFTQDERDLIEKDTTRQVDIRDLQFYNDKEILLRGKSHNNNLIANSGVVVKSEDLVVRDLRIRRGTPCRVDSVGYNCLFVRFELGEGEVLRFYRNEFDHYQIYANRWFAGRGSIVYGGVDFTIERLGNDCLLMVKNYEKFRAQRKRDRATGVRITDGDIMRDSIANDTLRFDE